ncbi:MCE family protein [Mycolicibacterium frederiksbergense]|uniref:MCE family protein n=1 Tax=Mycolicibacterium frederiksbergense TaxID=117567 RepID=A0A6H0RXR0_9MYCO|nr:MCE family protein [Mycolicibacterium frederiksbergense]QIV79993.1 MCE family protein [Mycolicibacterium frederiksbergense]
MKRSGFVRLLLAAVLVSTLTAGAFVVNNAVGQRNRIHVEAYFTNTNGLFVGDDVRIRGVNVGRIESIEAQPASVKVMFWVEEQYEVPAEVKAVILSPTLVTARAIQLTPPYQGGPLLGDNAVIPVERTAVPVEWDDFREQLEKLTDLLAPTEAGGVSTLGSLVNSAADNLRGQGANIRQTILELSQALSALGDHSGDTFTTVKNLAALVSALEGSTTLMRDLNQNFASVTNLFTNDSGEVAEAIADLSDVASEVKSFVADNREALGTTTDTLTSVSQALADSLGDIKQTLHVLPTVAANAANIYQPAQGTLSSALAVNNFRDPITFLCGAIQAASQLGAEQSSKLCVQYLAPIVKNRQYNFPPIGMNPFVGASARPNEITYSEDWMRPDHVPPAPAAPAVPPPPGADLLPAEAPPVALPTNPTAGLAGIMVPPGGDR